MKRARITYSTATNAVTHVPQERAYFTRLGVGAMRTAAAVDAVRRFAGTLSPTALPLSTWVRSVRTTLSTWLPSALILTTLISVSPVAQCGDDDGQDYERRRWDPIHFQPAIDTASDAQCLTCHIDVLTQKPLEQSPAGKKASESVAWYQERPSYKGEQDSFHRRHMVTPLAQELMDMQCTTCHRGNDPREEVPGSSVENHGAPVMRKSVDAGDVCLRCHGQFPHEVMNLPGNWNEVGYLYGDNCLLCHTSIRTNRHNVNYLKAANIEAAAKADSDVCFGCHGGRSWYRKSYEYPRHPWPGMPAAKPQWAEQRPVESDARFLTGR